MTKEKLTEIHALDDPHVPERLGQLVAYLNTLVAICPVELTQHLTEDLLLMPEQVVRLETAVPHIVVRETRMRVSALSGIGVLAGFVNSEHFRLFAAFEGEGDSLGSITRFGVYFVQREAP